MPCGTLRPLSDNPLRCSPENKARSVVSRYLPLYKPGGTSETLLGDPAVPKGLSLVAITSSDGGDSAHQE